MKTKQNKKFLLLCYHSLMLCFMFSLVAGNGCKSSKNIINNDQNNHVPEKKYGYWYDTGHPLIIWRNPAVSKEIFKQALYEFELNTLHQLIDDSIYCKDCDSDLLQLSGKGPLNFIQGQTASGGSTSGGGGRVSGGGEYPFYYSANFYIKIPDLIGQKQDTPINAAPKQFGYTKKPITVAVFDTGLDPFFFSLDAAYLAKIAPRCLPDAKHGWNFIQNNLDTKDDNNEKHGTVVTGFTLQQANEYHKNRVQILPVKTHNVNGESNLFHVLCGFAYISNSDIKAVNASFGYYSYGNNSCTLLFEKYIEYYLTRKDILLICAAGNADVAADAAIIAAKGPGINPRNLDVNPFYPACFSKDLQNVITVTTVNSHNNTVSLTQNYSPKYVDIGVNCDDALNIHCLYLFLNPVQPNSVIGSSYATPIVTGKICANYDAVTRKGIDKTKIIALMKKTAPALAYDDKLLKYAIKGCTIVNK